MVTMTAAQFNRAPSAVKQAVLSSGEPVLVTDQARPSLVVMRYADYLRLTDRPQVTDAAQWLEMDDDIDFEPEPMGIGLREVDL